MWRVKFSLTCGDVTGGFVGGVAFGGCFVDRFRCVMDRRYMRCDGIWYGKARRFLMLRRRGSTAGFLTAGNKSGLGIGEDREGRLERSRTSVRI